MERLFDMDFEDMRPFELVQNTKLYFQYLAFRSQHERDKAALVVTTVCDEQCYAAIELGDENALNAYYRAARFVSKYTDKYLHGASFVPLDPKP